MNGRMDLMEFSRSCNFLSWPATWRRSFGARVMTVPPRIPMAQNEETKGTVGQVSLRHAAVAAGLGRSAATISWSSPVSGAGSSSRRSSPISSPLGPSRRRESVHSLRAVRTRLPGKRLDEPGRTKRDEVRRNNMPYGLNGAIRFSNAEYGEVSVAGGKRCSGPEFSGDSTRPGPSAPNPSASPA